MTAFMMTTLVLLNESWMRFDGMHPVNTGPVCVAYGIGWRLVLLSRAPAQDQAWRAAITHRGLQDGACPSAFVLSAVAIMLWLVYQSKLTGMGFNG